MRHLQEEKARVALILRDYQEASIEAIYAHLRARDDNPCVVIPTGGGKTPVIAQVCKDAVLRWDGKVVIVSHVKELLEQSMDKLMLMAPELHGRVGIHCAGLNRRDVDQDIIIASIQSVYKNAADIGPRNLILVDEAHLIPPSGDGMYQSFLSDCRLVNPGVRVIGLTATPYRTTSGKICNPDTILNRVCYEVGVRELIDRGFLCPLRSKAGKQQVDCSGLHSRAGEFIPAEVEELMRERSVVDAAAAEIADYASDRCKALIFCAGIQHMAEVLEVLGGIVPEDQIGCVDGKTGKRARAKVLEDFKSGRIRYMLNVGVLTTGFDAPDIDMVALLRPTKSPGLYYQMVGRGFRIAEGKTDCLVLDYGGNIVRHGPVDQIRAKDKRFTTGADGTVVENAEAGAVPVYECTSCRELIEAPFPDRCPACGEPIPKDARHDAEASTESILSKPIEIKKREVLDTMYEEHSGKGGKPNTLRVIYKLGLNEYVSEWVCFNHPAGSWARKKAESWWRRRSVVNPPASVIDACALAYQGALCHTKSIRIKVDPSQEWPQIIGYELGPRPEDGWDSEGYRPF